MWDTEKSAEQIEFYPLLNMKEARKAFIYPEMK